MGIAMLAAVRTSSVIERHPFAASMPKIDVKLVAEAGMTIEGASGTVQIATGSGPVYPIRFSDSSDRRAIVDGFTVLVNGELPGAAAT